MSVQWGVDGHDGYQELNDAALIKLEMALQSNTRRVVLDATESGVGYALSIDLMQMCSTRAPEINVYRRQNPHLHDKWFVFSDPHDAEGPDIELGDDAADLLTIAATVGLPFMTYRCGRARYEVNFKEMRVKEIGNPAFVGSVREKCILRVQPPLEAQDDDDDTVPRCPISQMPMVEPVVATDGHTYEKRQLQRWLATKCTSPMTNEPMVPWMTRNFALETLVNKKRAAYGALASEKKRPRAAPGGSAPSVDSDEGGD